MIYDAQNKKCFTSPTCDKPSGGTAVPWQIYKLEEVGAETPPPTPAAAEEWVEFTGPNTKCERPGGEAPFIVSGLEACQAKAEAQGRMFMNYDASSKKCFTSPTCNRPQSGTATPWQIYKKEGAEVEPAPAPSPEVTEDGWVTFKPKHTKCERPAGETPFGVSGLAACQAKAEAQGRKFMNYDASRKQCFTSPTCDKPQSG